MANLETHNNGARKFLTGQFHLRDGFATKTLVEDEQLTSKSPTFMSLDPGGANRNVDLPGRLEGVPDVDSLFFWIINTADAAETLTVRNPANGTVDTIGQGQVGAFMGNGAQGYASLGVWNHDTVPDTVSDETVVAAIAVADATGGGTAAALTLQLDRSSDGVTPVASARQVLVRTGAVQFEPSQDLNANVTFGSATLGSIAASGSGWALVTTDATGAFACSATNAVDESVEFWVETAKGGDALAERAVCSFSNVDDATWSA